LTLIFGARLKAGERLGLRGGEGSRSHAGPTANSAIEKDLAPSLIG